MISHELDICNTQVPKIVVTTTGITHLEIELMRSQLPENVTMQDKLSSSTNYLLTYRCIFTPKYIQAIKWQIPIIRAGWAYDTRQGISRLQIFEGTVFSTSNISNDIFKNYFLIQGATHSDDVHRTTDFMISEEADNEKVTFCKKHGIPIIDPQDAFKNDFSLFSGTFKIHAHPRSEGGLFAGKVFLVDPKLPIKLFNKLKRLVVDNEGTRVSIEASNVDFVISDCIGDYKTKVHFYQLVFDCVESNSLLLPDFYEIRKTSRLPVLENCVCYVSNELADNKQIVTNKLQAMGARVKPKLDVYCNYFVVKSKSEAKKSIKQKVLTFDWVDQCLYALKIVRDDKYVAQKPAANLLTSKRNIQVTYLSDPKEMVFQFTGLPTHFKTKAIELCEKYQLRYFDCETYEKCTHLVMGRINTSEKFLSALANGAWVLRPDFVDNFDNSSSFNFEKYEWVVDESVSSADAKIIDAVARWRKHVMETEKPAFYKWVVKLYCEDAKMQSYKRVLVNGGARITEGNDFNQCFVSRNYKDPVPEKNVKTTDSIFGYLFRKE